MVWIIPVAYRDKTTGLFSSILKVPLLEKCLILLMEVISL